LARPTVFGPEVGVGVSKAHFPLSARAAMARRRVLVTKTASKRGVNLEAMMGVTRRTKTRRGG